MCDVRDGEGYFENTDWFTITDSTMLSLNLFDEAIIYYIKILINELLEHIVFIYQTHKHELIRKTIELFVCFVRG